MKSGPHTQRCRWRHPLPLRPLNRSCPPIHSRLPTFNAIAAKPTMKEWGRMMKRGPSPQMGMFSLLDRL